MATNKFQSKTLRALMACVFLASCGGGGDSGSEAPAPAPAPANYNVELYTGKTAVDYKKCDLVGDTLQTAGYFNLSKIAVYKDSIELLESFENCSDKDYYFFEIRTIKESTVGENYYGLDAVIPIKLPPTAKYPSGFYKISDNDYFVVGSAAARSNRNFELDEAAVAELNLKQGLYSGWDYFAHGFYRYGKNTPSGRILAAGASAPPVVVDGQGNGAQFYAPHDLEADAQGLLYTVDNGMVRTITRDYTVKTVPNAEVWVGGAVKALDADRAADAPGRPRESARRGDRARRGHPRSSRHPPRLSAGRGRRGDPLPGPHARRHGRCRLPREAGDSRRRRRRPSPGDGTRDQRVRARAAHAGHRAAPRPR